VGLQGALRLVQGRHDRAHRGDDAAVRGPQDPVAEEHAGSGVLEGPRALALAARVHVAELDPALGPGQQVVVVQVLVADVAAHGDRQGDGGHPRPRLARPAEGRARHEGRGHRPSDDEHVRVVVDEAFELRRIGRTSRPGDRPQGDGVDGQRRSGITAARARFELGEQPHEGGAVAGQRALRVLEGRDLRGLRLHALDEGPRARLHGGEALLCARLRPARPARGLHLEVDGRSGLHEDEQRGQGGEHAP
jgi:hypothetical protein